MIVGVQHVKVIEPLLDVFLLHIVVVQVFGAVSLLHGVNEVGCLRVPPVSETGDVECGHHVMILMNEIVAVEHVDSIPRSISGNNLYLLVGA